MACRRFRCGGQQVPGPSASTKNPRSPIFSRSACRVIAATVVDGADEQVRNAPRVSDLEESRTTNSRRGGRTARRNCAAALPWPPVCSSHSHSAYVAKPLVEPDLLPQLGAETLLPTTPMPPHGAPVADRAAHRGSRSGGSASPARNRASSSSILSSSMIAPYELERVPAEHAVWEVRDDLLERGGGASPRRSAAPARRSRSTAPVPQMIEQTVRALTEAQVVVADRGGGPGSSPSGSVALPRRRSIQPLLGAPG